MNPIIQSHLIFNEEQCDHQDVISQLILGADHLECVVAFAKISGLTKIIDILKDRLKNGLTARFSIGLDFFQSEPEVLRTLLSLTKNKQIELYISNSEYTFHPKIYAASNKEGSTILIGSANLTSGGFSSNYEATARINDPSGTLLQSIVSYIDSLIDEGELVKATNKLINDYARSFEINKWQQKLARKRTKNAIDKTDIQSGVQLNLSQLLLDMKNDESDQGFQSMCALRKQYREAAKIKINELALLNNLSPDNFTEYYESLIEFFLSSGLHRGKNIIARNASKFHKALIDLVNLQTHSPRNGYELLYKHFKDIPSAGVNVLSEILHAIDSNTYAVMNQNSVHGLSLANIGGFPQHPTKENVDAESYARFCDQAKKVMDELRLNDFTELDALFNYAYW